LQTGSNKKIAPLAATSLYKVNNAKMKRLVLFSLLSVLLVCGCAGRKRQSANTGTENQKPTFVEHLKWIILWIFEREKEDQKKIPGTNTPDPRLPE